MNKLIKELERLYFLNGQRWSPQKPDDSREPAVDAESLLTPAVVARSLAGQEFVLLDLVSADGMVRTMVVNFHRSGDWGQVATLYQAVQNDLNLPAPAVSVSGSKGYGLWFSLQEPVPAAQARAFLDALRVNYLAAIPMVHVGLRPDADMPAAEASSEMKLPPSLHRTSGKWSAFVDPSLGSIFIDEPWLETAPNMDRQAVILAGMESIKAKDFQSALVLLQSMATPDASSTPALAEEPVNSQEGAAPNPGTRGRRSTLTVGTSYSDPESFLLAVMNDPSASARHRIAAAKALLPSSRKKNSE